MSSNFHGQCQCGAFGYRVSAPPFGAYTCHCQECQGLTSSAFSVCAQFPAEAVVLTRGSAATRTRDTDSGNRLTMWFCSHCGSTLYCQNSARPRISTAFIGTLDDPSVLTVSAHIWLDRALPWFVIPPYHRAFQRGADWSDDYRDDIARYRP